MPEKEGQNPENLIPKSPIGEISWDAVKAFHSELVQAAQSEDLEQRDKLFNEFKNENPNLFKAVGQMAKGSKDPDMVILSALFTYMSVRRKLQEKELEKHIEDQG